MARNDSWINFGPLRGQNSTENPLSLPPGTAIATSNVVLDPEGSVAVKRNGSSNLSGAPSGTYLVARHKAPGSTEANAELWAFTFTAPSTFGAQRKVGSAAFVVIPWTSTVSVIRTVTLNGKMFIAAFTGGLDRLLVWDGTVVREVGLTIMLAPTVANTGAGAYPAILRYYKTDERIIDAGGRTIARSDLSAATSFTPSGVGTAARVTRGTVEINATHWVVWGSPDNVTYYQLAAPIAVATTTYDDSVQPQNYSGTQPDEVGTYSAPPSVTRIITDGNRLIMAGKGTTATSAGAGETEPKTNRVWFTPVLGSSDQGDDERIPNTGSQKNFIDLGENTNDGAISELVGPVNGVIFVFTKRRIWKLVPTGDVAKPYLSYPVSDRYGANNITDFGDTSRSIMVGAVPGEDERGGPSAYFLSETGLYRVGDSGIQYVSYEIQDALNARNLTYAWLFSYPQKRQIWIVTPNAGLTTTKIFVYHWGQGNPDQDGDIRGGWTTWDYENNLFVSYGCTHNVTPGTAGWFAEILVPYFAIGAGIRVFERAAATDGSTNYAGSVTYAPILPTLGQSQVRLGNPTLIATAASGVSMQMSATRDFGTETRSATVSLTATGSETQVVRTVEGLFSADDTAISIHIGDASPNANLWKVNWLTAPVTRQETR